MRHVIVTITASWLLCAALMSSAGAQNSSATLQKLVSVDIPAQRVSTALIALSHQAGVQVLMPGKLVESAISRGVKGTMPLKEALAQLLEGTHLVFQEVGDNAIGIAALPLPLKGAQDPRARKRQSTEQTTDPAAGKTAASSPDKRTNRHTAELQEVIVTGTHIHGVSTTSQIIDLSRSALVESGLPTIGQILQSLPESFSGGLNPTVASSGGINQGRSDVSESSTANLWGIGADSTLTLIDGHRLAYDGVDGAVDLGLVPLIAVDRIQVSTDGSSAIYGSDAVAGVVNVILRNNYQGAETTASTNVATQGGGFEQQYGQLVGATFERGSIMAAYQYYRQDSLSTDQRAQSAGVSPQPFDLVPYTEQNSAVVAGSIALSQAYEAHVEATYAHRDTDTTEEGESFIGTVNAYSAVGDLSGDLGDGRTIDVQMTGATDRQAAVVSLIPPFGPPSSLSATSTLYGPSMDFDGPLLRLPSGALRGALGIGYDNEGLDTAGYFSPGHVSRNIEHAYIELYMPLVPPNSSRLGLNELDTDLSARYEHYSDFGPTTTPKFGVRYAPTREVVIKGSWGRAFHAPTLDDLYLNNIVALYPADTFGGTPPPAAQALVASGGNRSLRPETATTWTASARYSPAWAAGEALSLSYVDIIYRDRIGLPFQNFFTALTDPTLAPYTVINPSLGVQQSYTSRAALFANPFGLTYMPESVSALFVDIYQNISTQYIHGVIAINRYSWLGSLGRWETTLNLAWLNFREQLLPGAPLEQITGTIYNPPSFKGRVSLGWQGARLGATVFVNHIAGEQDNTTMPGVSIGAWTTADMQLRYDTGSGGAWNDGITVSISSQNLFNSSPPRVRAMSTLPTGVGFDSANASLLGRVIGITLSKEW